MQGATHARARATAISSEHDRGGWSEVGAAEPAVFLIVSLREPERDVATYVSQAAERHPREWLAAARRALSVAATAA